MVAVRQHFNKIKQTLGLSPSSRWHFLRAGSMNSFGKKVGRWTMSNACNAAGSMNKALEKGWSLDHVQRMQHMGCWHMQDGMHPHIAISDVEKKCTADTLCINSPYTYKMQKRMYMK